MNTGIGITPVHHQEGPKRVPKRVLHQILLAVTESFNTIASITFSDIFSTFLYLQIATCACKIVIKS